MAERFIALDIGADGICGIVFADGARVKAGSVEFDSNAPSEMAREAIVATALKRLLDEMKPAVGKAVISIEGQSVFSRLVKLPFVAPDKLWRTIEHEAVQNIPFPIDEVVWDAHVIDPAATEPEALLVAVKSELVEGLVHAVTANGLKVERIEVAPVALANAVRAQMSDPSECVLLVDAGAESTNLIFVDGPRVFFRSLSISGSDSTRLDREVERSIAFYTGQQGGNAPARVLASDDSALSVGGGLAAPHYFSINLVSDELRRDRAARRKQPLLIATAVALVLIAGLWIFGLNAMLARTSSEIAAVGGRVKTLKKIEKRMAPLENELAAQGDTAAAYQAAIEQRGFWKETFEEIGRRLPEGMFLLASEPIREEEVLKGSRISVVSYLDKEPAGQDSVKALRDALRASERFSRKTKVFSRPSRKLFARQFELDVYFKEGRL